MKSIIQFLSDYYSQFYRLIYHCIFACAIVVGYLRIRKLNSVSVTFFILLTITFFVEIIGAFLGHYFRNNNILYTPFTALQYLFISYAFNIELRNRYLNVLAVCIVAFGLINAIFWQPYFQMFGSNLLLLECLFIIFLVMFYLSIHFKKANVSPITQYPTFIIGMGLLIFSISSIVSFGFSTIVNITPKWNNVSKWVRIGANYLLYLSFIPAFLSSQKSLNDPAAGK